MRLFNLFILFFLILDHRLHAQSLKNDTAFLTRAVHRIEESHKTTLGINSRLYNGVRYKEYISSPNDIGQPYWGDGLWQDATINYDGIEFSDVELNYNLLTDKIIIINPYTSFKEQLISAKVSSFNLQEHTFVKLTDSDAKNLPVPFGFYEVLCNGSVNLYKRQTVFRQPVVISRVVVGDYRRTTKYYALKNGLSTLIRSKHSLLKLLEDQRIPLRKFIKANNPRWRNKETFMVQTLQFYNSLNK